MGETSLSAGAFRLSRGILPATCVGLFVVGAWYAPAVVPARARARTPEKTIEYNRDVRPIISKCFTCHGHDPKQIQAGLRLDLRDSAIKKLADGNFGIVPFHPEKSELIKRVFADDEFTLMPPKSSNKILSVEEKQTLRRWIAEGAEYKEHWAFVKPVRPALPTVKLKAWPKNDIDRFILAKIESKGLKPSAEADRRTLIRRATLDVTGLPPTPKEVDAFLADRKPGAYERVVDRLLASPRYGERMAMDWLDCARYADSNGYQADYERFQWRWRDWVINAFNSNMPYDKFTVDQIAGDLEAHPSLDQRLATGFNRNHRINTEGGVVVEEWRVETVIDRVETTSQTWLGLTAGCARCHDHKYDPISQKDFYSLFAYFNNVPETGSGEERPVNHPPLMKAPTSEQQAKYAILQSRVDDLNRKVASQVALHSVEAQAWHPSDSVGIGTLNEGVAAHYRFADKPSVLAGDGSAPEVKGKVSFSGGHSAGAVATSETGYLDLGKTGDFDTHDAFSYGAWLNPVDGIGSPISRMDTMHDFRGYDLFFDGGRAAVHLINKWPENAIKVIARTPIPNGQWSHVFATYDGSATAAGVKIYINGIQVPTDVEQQSLTGTIKTTVTTRVGRRTDTSVFNGQIEDVAIYKRALSKDEVLSLANANMAATLAAIPLDKRTPAQRDALTRIWLAQHDSTFQRLDKDQTVAEQERQKLDNEISTVMIMEEMPKPRPAYILLRGQYDHHGPEVTAALPSFLQIKGKTFPRNRLGLAQWIVDPANPLTARVTMNRLWERFFGTGIVATTEDFGTRAEYPSHPELLDWLATEFISQKWDLKRMIREMVTSATYRQSSNVTPSSIKSDPTNRLLARGPRFRLPAEIIRDQAMYAGGLLTETLGGPSVRPYQPDGVWDDINVYGNLRNYKHDMGPNLHRRSLYTIWKRTAAPPNMTLFDVPSRETCRVSRARTDTPLQALTLLNDITYVEAAKALAVRMLTEGGTTPAQRVDLAFKVVLARDPSANESKILVSNLDRLEAHFQKNPGAAKKYAMQGDVPMADKLNTVDVAAYSLIASMVLNLDETINKE